MTNQILFLWYPNYIPYGLWNVKFINISNKRLLEGGAYLTIYLWGGALIGGRRLLEEIRYS